jgi:hypothetical protein
LRIFSTAEAPCRQDCCCCRVCLCPRSSRWICSGTDSSPQNRCLKEGSWGLTPDSNSPSTSSKYDQAAGHAFVLRRGDLAAPTRISPAPAADQKQHHKNNQYGFHLVTSPVRGSGTSVERSSRFFTINHHKKRLRHMSDQISSLRKLYLYGRDDGDLLSPS